MESKTFDPSDVFDINPVIVPGFLGQSDCERLIGHFHSGEKESGKLRPAVRNASDELPGARSIRNNTVCWLEETERTVWIYEKILVLMKKINAAVYGFQIEKLQPIQIAEYKSAKDSEAEFYRPHLDICTRGWNTQRKLSLSLQLTPPENYEGGNLLMFGDKNDLLTDPNNLQNNLIQRRQFGAAIIFPSFFEHEVTPVTKGTRYSLVAWMEGPNWK